ncbi:MAG: hypothetical protein PHH11_13550 [Methylomonas sp.]|nr:hypothetical protein [Methylomonas sp.]
MSDYRRVFVPGGRYFFTVVTCLHRPVFELPENVELLRNAFKRVMVEKPLKIDSIVVLPDLCIVFGNYRKTTVIFPDVGAKSKKYVSKRIGAEGKRPGEKDIWQRRFWEHLIRDEDDWRRHMDYIHYNPVKHRLAPSPIDWPYSSFKKAVEAGWYDAAWGAGTVNRIRLLILSWNEGRFRCDGCDGCDGCAGAYPSYIIEILEVSVKKLLLILMVAVFSNVNAANNKNNKPKATLDETLSFIDRKLAENTYKNKYVSSLSGDYFEDTIIESRLDWSAGNCADIRVVTSVSRVVDLANYPAGNPEQRTEIIGFSLRDLNVNSVKYSFDNNYMQSDRKTRLEIPKVSFQTIGDRADIKINYEGRIISSSASSLFFDDISIAERVTKALVHAVKLCQPSDVEPF